MLLLQTKALLLRSARFWQLQPPQAQRRPIPKVRQSVWAYQLHARSGDVRPRPMRGEPPPAHTARTARHTRAGAPLTVRRPRRCSAGRLGAATPRSTWPTWAPC